MNLRGISASEFADTIGVQRSNVTHVLHERNKPGLQFIVKILESFPEINAKWLLTGEGEMLEKNKALSLKQTELFQNTENIDNLLPENSEIPLPEKEKSISEENVIINNPPVTENKDESANSVSENKDDSVSSVSEKKEKPRSVDQIVIFYSDNTCKTYSPS
ncbi:MAG: helix-turn-helix transcriptional regulator [Prolixibacteraceae bacterium]|nr:helix-turn-helix transcriptional regulator [Prolixibacteraceae bacterium]